MRIKKASTTSKSCFHSIVCIYVLSILTLSGCQQITSVPKSTELSGSQETSIQITEQPVVSCQKPVEVLEPQQHYSLPGALVYSSLGDFRLVGGTPLTVQRLPTTEPSAGSLNMIGFSPSGEWFAYYTGSVPEAIPFKVHLISAGGEKVTTRPEYEFVPDQEETSAGMWVNARWIAENRLIVSIPEPEENNPDKVIRVILDPFTGEWFETILENIPEPYAHGDFTFDPNLRYVFYRANLEAGKGTKTPATVLWDLENEKELWQSETLFYPYAAASAAVWAPDGSMVAFVGPEVTTASVNGGRDSYGVYVLDLDSLKPRLITDFLSIYRSFSVSGLSWSPDGRYLAFRLVGEKISEGVTEEVIYLYDSVISDVIDLCPVIGESGVSVIRGLVWSPDSRYLAYVSDHFPSDRALLVIDVQTGTVSALAQSVGELGGWSGIFH